MRLGINLRGDLAKLTDEQIASHLDQSIAQREGLASHAGDRANRWIYSGGAAVPFGRGPLHARIFYRLMGFLYGGPLNGRSLGDLYVLDCEIKDVIDELKRRVHLAQRQRLG
ncbi:MAG: hypothetical protein EOO23_02700 [Comamonadaceae bacterium]|nr:MAG: hypothetical protein EOO23_02700 [Comamonadaceae bacterium]